MGIEDYFTVLALTTFFILLIFEKYKEQKPNPVTNSFGNQCQENDYSLKELRGFLVEKPHYILWNLIARKWTLITIL